MPKQTYYCPECETEVEIEVSLTSPGYKNKRCKKCKSVMDRVWQPTFVTVRGGTGAGKHSNDR